MDEYYGEHQQENQDGNWTSAARARRSALAILVISALVVALAVAVGYGYHQQAMVHALTDQAAVSNQTVSQLQSQVSSLTSRLGDMTAASSAAATPTGEQTSSPAPAAASSEAPAPTSTVVETPADNSAAKPAPTTSTKRSTTKHRAPTDKRYAHLQAELADQKKELKSTQDQLEKYRSDLEGSINSTRDELSGSIAKTHEELVALEKRGERNYVEFDLLKSKQFQRIGPISISLRKADTKHKRYDLSMLVDDNELSKRQVNLYEPVTIHTENDTQPVQVVVNKIEKNFVHGYVSSPKYKKSELASTGGATVTPVSAPASSNSSPAGPQ